MKKSIIQTLESQFKKKNIPDFKPGDTVRVEILVREFREDSKRKEMVEKTRWQPFEGVVISKRGSGLSRTFKVRKVTQGVGIERTFPLHSPFIGKIKVLRKGKVRRAKLYYLRDRIGKKARVKEKR